MNIKDIIYKISVLSIYFLMTIMWLILFIFLGEDTKMNIYEDYKLYMQFTGLYLISVLLHILYSKQLWVNIIMIVAGVLLIPVIITGYLGAININKPIFDLMNARLFTAIAFVGVYGIGIIKTYIKEYEY